MQKILTLLCLFFAITYSALAQNKAEQALQHFYTTFPVEKVFIQYSNEDYMVGEELRFKCYVFEDYQLTERSTNLYVELYNQDKKLLEKTIVPLIGGVGESSFDLNKEWPEGVYYIRAYTQWMLNFDETFPYVHSFLLYNPQSNLTLQPKAINWTAVAFPESGALVAGYENKVAIRLFTESFLPENWSGVLQEKNFPQKDILHFSSYNQEIASFQFLPETGKTYIVVIKDNNGRSKTISLPEVQSSGFLLQTKHINDSIVCKLVFKGIAEKGAYYYLLGQMQQQVVFKAKIRSNDSSILVKLPTNQLTNGILHLTLFDKNEKAVTDRLVFISSENTTLPVLQFDTLSLQQRALNSWTFPIDSLNSISYTAIIADAGRPRAKENLLSSIWLSNDIRYKSVDPGWYFTDNSLKQREALDAFLLTEKWRWFNWGQLLDGHYPNTAYQRDYFLSYTGTIFKRKRLLLNTDVNLIFLFKDKSTLFQQFKTDSSGSFQIDGALFDDTIRVFYMLNSKRQAAKDIHILFEQNNRFKKLLAPLPRNGYNLVFRQQADTLSQRMSRRMVTLSSQKAVEEKYINLTEVRVHASKKELTERLNNKLSSPMFRSFDEQIYDFENDKTLFTGFPSVYSWLIGHVPGLSGPRMGNGIGIYLDEMLSDLKTLNMLSMSDVAMIKVLNNYTSLGRFSSTSFSNNANRAYNPPNKTIVVYTRRGSITPLSGLPQSTLSGYKSLKPVFVFNYADDVYRKVEKDTRELLYWNGSFSNEKEKATIRFYMNDVSKELRLTIMGFDNFGKPVYIQKAIPVK